MTQQTEEEAKTNTGNMATDRTLLELELSCPVGTSGTVLTRWWGHGMEPDITTGVNKGRQCGIRQPGKHLRRREEAMNFNVEQPVRRPVTANIWLFSAVLTVYLCHFSARECGWSGWERESVSAILASPDMVRRIPNSDLCRDSIQ